MLYFIYIFNFRFLKKLWISYEIFFYEFTLWKHSFSHSQKWFLHIHCFKMCIISYIYIFFSPNRKNHNAYKMDHLTTLTVNIHRGWRVYFVVIITFICFCHKTFVYIFFMKYSFMYKIGEYLWMYARQC